MQLKFIFTAYKKEDGKLLRYFFIKPYDSQKQKYQNISQIYFSTSFVCMAFLFFISANKNSTRSSTVFGTYKKCAFWAAGMEILDSNFPGIGELGNGSTKMATAFSAYSKNEFFAGI
jgi:hypothetical protein